MVAHNPIRWIFQNSSMVLIQQRKLGESGLSVPVMGVGTLSWGERFVGYGKTHSRDDVIQAYRTCLDAGLNFFDTAEGYGRGANERLLGECIELVKRPAIIATKYAPFNRFTPLLTRLSPHALLNALDHSLERLGLSRIDLYQIHFPSYFVSVGGLMDVLAEAVQTGRVRAVGVSNYSASLMRQAHSRLARYGIALASNQVHYSLLHRYPETNGVLDVCHELKVTLIAYRPLEEGILTGKYRTTPRKVSPILRLVYAISPKDPFGEMKGAAYSQRSLRPEKIEPLLVALEKIAHDNGRTISQVAINWLMNRDPCVLPIVGAKNARQAKENAEAIGWKLKDEEYEYINRVEVTSR